MSIKVVIGEVRFSYANVWEPKKMEGSDEVKYSTCVLIPKSNKEAVRKVMKAIEEAKQEGIVKFGGKIPNNLKLPLRDGDKEREDDENFTNCYFLNASCKFAPGVIDRKKQQIIDTTEFYSGCYGYVSLNFYAFNTNGNKGIACGLNNIMKTRDGELLGGRSRAEDDFADINIDDNEDVDFFEEETPKGFKQSNDDYGIF